jgi:hypothetical protein
MNSSQMDIDKLAHLAEMEPVSAGSNYLRAKRRLEKIHEEEGQDSTASPAKAKPLAESKSRIPASRKVTKKAPQVPKLENIDEAEAEDDSAETLPLTPTPKRRKTTTPADEYLEAEVNIGKEEPNAD